VEWSGGLEAGGGAGRAIDGTSPSGCSTASASFSISGIPRLSIAIIVNIAGFVGKFLILLTLRPYPRRVSFIIRVTFVGIMSSFIGYLYLFTKKYVSYPVCYFL